MATTPLGGVTDLFEDGIVLNGWTEVQPATGWTVDEDLGSLILAPAPNATNNYFWQSMAATESMDGRHVRVSVDMRGLNQWITSSHWSTEFAIAVYMTGNAGSEQVQIAVARVGGTLSLIARYKNGGAFQTVGTLAFDPNNHRHLEVAIESGTAYLRYSTDNVSWTDLGWFVHPWSAAELLSPTLHIYMGPGDMPAPGSMSISEINPGVSAPTVFTLSGSESFGMTEAVSNTFYIEEQDLSPETLSLSESGGETIVGTGTTATFTLDYGEAITITESGNDNIRTPVVVGASPPKSIMRFRRHR